MNETIEALLVAAQVGSSLREKIRREFPLWEKDKKERFVEFLQWGVIQTLAKKGKQNYLD